MHSPFSDVVVGVKLYVYYILPRRCGINAIRSVVPHSHTRTCD